VTLTAFPGITSQWQQIVAVRGDASMRSVRFAAIGQREHQATDGLFVDRAIMGFALVALPPETVEGAQACWSYRDSTWR